MKVIKWLDDNLEEMILIILLVAITLIMGVQVFARYVLNNSFTWSEELVRYLFIYMGFISISYCIKKWISIKINQIIDMFPKKAYTILQLILNIILFLFFMYLSVYAYSYLMMSIESHQLSPALEIPMYYIQAAPLIGFSLATIRAFQQIVLDIKRIIKFMNGNEGEDGEVC